jgi:hypothetical protein
MQKISRGLVDHSLRNALNSLTSIEMINRHLVEENLLFSTPEFEDAYNFSLTQCQFEDQADRLAEFRMWWELLNLIVAGENSIESNIARTSCSMLGSCTTCSCA